MQSDITEQYMRKSKYHVAFVMSLRATFNVIFNFFTSQMVLGQFRLLVGKVAQESEETSAFKVGHLII